MEIWTFNPNRESEETSWLKEKLAHDDRPLCTKVDHIISERVLNPQKYWIVFDTNEESAIQAIAEKIIPWHNQRDTSEVLHILLVPVRERRTIGVSGTLVAHDGMIVSSGNYSLAIAIEI